MIHNIKNCIFIFVLVFIKDSIICLPFGGTWRQIGTDIDGKAGGDRFGSSIAISADGTTIIIGAPYNNNINGVSAGQVRVYSINNATSGNWTQIGSGINGKARNDLFGGSVCISEDGKTIAAGANGNDANGDNSGQVRVFSYNAVPRTWEQVGSDINGEKDFDNFGSSVDISADGATIAIGASGNDNNNGVDSGHVRLFTRNATSGNWAQVGFDIDGEAGGDFSGYSLALSSNGSTIAVGAQGNDNANGADAGHVRVFSNNSTSRNWTQVGSDIDGKAEGVYSGYSVAISSDGKTVAIGAPFNNFINSNVAGSVRVYTINSTSGNWTQFGLDINGAALNDKLGYSVAVSADGKTIAIGAPNNGIANRTFSGHVRVFSMNSSSGNWAQVGSDINGEAQGDQSGYSVAISNDGFTLAIGAPFNDNSNNANAGHVRVYKYELPTNSPTKTPTKMPTKTPTKSPTKIPTKTPTKFPTRQPTKTPTKMPTTVPTKKPTKSPTKAPSQVILPVPIPIMVPIQAPSATPVYAPTNCGLFGLNFFCPRRGECGFWRRLLNLHGC